MVENLKDIASSDGRRIVSSIELKEDSKGNKTQVLMIKGYHEKIESKLAKICEDILDVLDKHLIPSAASGGLKVKM